jgi:glycosyltransferase involved in cell wall biosynthesis
VASTLNPTPNQRIDAARRVDVIVPAYNEAPVLAANLAEITTCLTRKLGTNWRLIVVNDGSQDATADIADCWASTHPHCSVIHHARNQGLGAALRSGFAQAQGDAIVTLDADLSYEPTIVPQLVQALFAREADIVVASPYGQGGRCSGVPPLRLALSVGANRLLAYGTNFALSAPTSMVRAYSARAVRELQFTASGLDANLEIIADAMQRGFRLAEIPAHLNWRGDPRARARRTSLRALWRHAIKVIGWSAKLRSARRKCTTAAEPARAISASRMSRTH